MGAQWTWRLLCHLDPTRLEQWLAESRAPALESLVGWEFRAFFRPIAGRGWMAKPFSPACIQGFFRRVGEPDPREARWIHGYNSPLAKGAGEWEVVSRGLQPLRTAFFDVYRPGDGPRFTPSSIQALYLDHRVHENGRLWGRRFRELLVAVTDDLLVSKVYVRLLARHWPVGYRVLERHQEHDFKR
jgi:hypothetical protein